jgi:cytochrome c oxidase subunit II
MMRRAALALLIVASTACADYRLLETRSPEADAIARLWWVLLAGTGVPALITIGVLLVAATRRPRSTEGLGSERRQTWTILIAGGLVPLGIIFGLLAYSIDTGSRVRHFAQPNAVTIDVIGRQFWWEVRYPDHDIVTANELHIPVGQPVRLRLTAGDVIHSFWVPQLHGKHDMLPGKLDELWLRADAPGVYRGQCAEFCGVQHALMLFEVVADPPEDFNAWLALHREPAATPTDALAERGLEVFLAAECGHCHTLRGLTPELAMGVMGPDLTHLASRRTLGAGILPNNRGNLGGWILAPQAIKPGNNMPASQLPADDLHALLHFLETLH